MQKSECMLGAIRNFESFKISIFEFFFRNCGWVCQGQKNENRNSLFVNKKAENVKKYKS